MNEDRMKILEMLQAGTIGVDEATAEAVYADIRAKRQTTRYLHMPPVLAGEVPELDS